MKLSYGLGWMSRTALIAVLIGGFVFRSPAAETAEEAVGKTLDSLIAQENLWRITHTEFMAQQKALRFRWLSAEKETAQSTLSDVTMFLLPVYQTLAHFETGRLKGLTFSLYNRNDTKNVIREEWDRRIQHAIDHLSALTNTEPVFREQIAAGIFRTEGVEWQTVTTRYLLEHSSNRAIKTRDVLFRPGFIRLEISPAEKKTFMEDALAQSSTLQSSQSKAALLARVKRNLHGDVSLDSVPMVKQDRREYSVIASAERVMRYYGTQVDEQELAQLARSSTISISRVTNEAMFTSLKKIDSKLGVRTRTLEEANWTTLRRLVDDYNRTAKRGKRASEIKLNATATPDALTLYSQMEPDILREVRTRNAAAMNAFQKDVQTQINAGIPLLWSVVFGIVPESGGRKGGGGHTRLIIGYNTAKNEILYSDSWGIGHELKRMPVPDAWTITVGLSTIEPL